MGYSRRKNACDLIYVKAQRFVDAYRKSEIEPPVSITERFQLGYLTELNELTEAVNSLEGAAE